jgi:hypothetical protein
MIVFPSLIKMTGAISGSGTAYYSGAPEFTPGFSGVCVTQSSFMCQAVKHTCSGNLGKVKILRYIRSDMYTALFSGKMAPWQTGPCA